MPVRLARLSDLDAAARIFAAGFHEEEVLGQLLHPYREQYPDDFVQYWKWSCRKRYWDYARVLIVSFVEKTDEDGRKREVLTGVAAWNRMGPGWMKVWGLWGWWDPSKYSRTGRFSLYTDCLRIGRLIQKFVVFLSKISSIIWPNRAASKNPVLSPNNFNNLVAHFVSPFYTSPPQRSTTWDLSTLAVHPEYRELGHGRELVAWGIERAKRDNVLASVVSAKGRERFYARCGFTKIVGWATDGEGNPLKKNGVEGGAVMFTPSVYTEVGNKGKSD